MMISKTLETSMKLMLGEEVSEEEKQELHEYSIRYELVRFLYVEKRKAMAKEGDLVLKDFHFSPGSNFMETPIYDVVEHLLKVDGQIERGEYEELIFGDRHTSFAE